MIKILKSNKLTILLILFVCFVFALNPQKYANSCLNAVSVWAIKIFPVMFPFFVFTRIIINLSENKPNFLDKFFNKFYNTPTGSFKTFFLSALSGYPMGAKLICVQFDDNKISSNDAKKMLSFCSISGPMFMLGTVGLSILGSYKAGIIILVSNIIASLINGIIYRGKTKESSKQKLIYLGEQKRLSLGEQVSDSLNSILMVGAYIVLSFLLIDMLKNLHIIEKISSTVCSVLNLKHSQDIVSSLLCGLIEITRGIIELNTTNVTLNLKVILSSTLIGFGGFSIFFQSLHFLEKLKICKRIILLQKLTQALLCLFISIFFCIIFL
jgi:sporulation integral membrane protein YlbJ